MQRCVRKAAQGACARHFILRRWWGRGSEPWFACPGAARRGAMRGRVWLRDRDDPAARAPPVSGDEWLPHGPSWSAVGHGQEQRCAAAGGWADCWAAQPTTQRARKQARWATACCCLRDATTAGGLAAGCGRWWPCLVTAGRLLLLLAWPRLVSLG